MPASSRPPPRPPDERKPAKPSLPILYTLHNLLEQYNNICLLIQSYSVSSTEQQIATDCLQIIYQNMLIIHSQLQLKFKLERSRPSIPQYFLSLYHAHIRSLWFQLSFPHPTRFRTALYQTILAVEKLILLLAPQFHKNYQHSKKSCRLTVTDQIVHQPTKIINPYLLSLQRNYYHPLDNEPFFMPKVNHQTPENNPAFKLTESRADNKDLPIKTTEAITVEHSLDAITDLISEIEADDPPTQPQKELQMELPKQTLYKHRFSLYKKGSAPAPGTSTSQVKLFQSLFCSIKAADLSAKILPIRSNINIFFLSNIRSNP